MICDSTTAIATNEFTFTTQDELYFLTDLCRDNPRKFRVYAERVLRGGRRYDKSVNVSRVKNRALYLLQGGMV